MASYRLVVLLAAAVAAAAFLPPPAAAEVFKVGDSAGWTLKYPGSWSAGKNFTVGDTLTFSYPAGKHTVVEVNGADFKACNSRGSKRLNAWSTGDDSVTLDTAGRRWFICGVGSHCDQGMKLLVVVADGAPSSSASSLVSGAVSRAAVAAGAVVVAVLAA